MPERVIIAAAKQSRRVYRAGAAVLERGGPITSVIFKAVLFGLLLLYVQGSGFAGWPTFLFVATAIVCYAQPVSKTFAFGTSLFLLISLSLLLTSRFTITLPVTMHASALGEFLFAAILGFLFFILLGIKNVVFARRRQWYAILFVALIYGISLVFFTSGITGSVWRSTGLLAIFMYLLFREYFSAQDHPKSRALLVTSLSLTLLTIELAWVINLLPLGFSKSASVLTLLSIVSASITDRYVRGALSARFLRMSFLLVIALTAIIFWSSNWAI